MFRNEIAYKKPNFIADVHLFHPKTFNTSDLLISTSAIDIKKGIPIVISYLNSFKRTFLFRNYSGEFIPSTVGNPFSILLKSP
jgi:hypothetical protein